jgi:hypothetical protein
MHCGATKAQWQRKVDVGFVAAKILRRASAPCNSFGVAIVL